MNKNDFLICAIGLIIVIYMVDNSCPLVKLSENFDTGFGSETKSLEFNKTEIELLDLFKSKIESEIDQITKTEAEIEKTKSDSEAKLSMETISNSENTTMSILSSVIIILIIIFILCCSSCVLSMFTPSSSIRSDQLVQLAHPNSNPSLNPVQSLPFSNPNPNPFSNPNPISNPYEY